VNSPAGTPADASEGRLPAYLSLLVCIIVVLAPVLAAPGTRALGRACSEAPMHLWGLWVATDGLGTHGPLVRDAAIGFPGHFRHHLIDPLNLGLFAPAVQLLGGVTGAVVGWNLLHAGMVLAGGLGCIALGTRWQLRGWPLAVLVTSVCASPALMQHAELGRTEYLPSLLLPWVLAGLYDAARGNRPARGWAAGILLGAILSSGPTLALFVGPLVAGCVLAWTQGLDRGRRVRLGMSVLLPGLVGAALAITSLTLWPPPQNAAMMAGEGRELVNSVELGTLIRMAPPTRELETTLYLGLGTLCLGVLALARRPGQAWAWALAALALVVVGIGPYPYAFGQPLAGPDLLLTSLLPPLRAVSGWPRAAWVVCLPLGMCAALGLSTLGRASRWAGPLVVLLLVFDHASYPGPRGTHRLDTHFTARPPETVRQVVSALPGGPLFTLPATTPASDQTCAMDSPWVLWSAALHRTVTANQGIPTDGLATGNGLAAGVVRMPERLSQRLRTRPAFRNGSEGCAVTEVAHLQEQGIVAIVVEDTLPRGAATRTVLETVLGSPHHEAGSTAAWEVDRWLAEHPAAPAPCALEWVPPPRR